MNYPNLDLPAYLPVLFTIAAYSIRTLGRCCLAGATHHKCYKICQRSQIFCQKLYYYHHHLLAETVLAINQIYFLSTISVT